MTYFVYLNGPPKSGKDTIANLLAERYENGVQFKFAQMLREAVGAYFGIDEAEYDRQKDNKIALRFDSMKVWPGMSYRQFVMRLSEKVLKPNFGKGYLGVAFAERILQIPKADDIDQVYIVTELGFSDELYEFRCRVSVTDSLLIQLHRDGLNFNNDSRGYVTDVIQPVKVSTNCSVAESVAEVESLIRDMLIHYNDTLQEAK